MKILFLGGSGILSLDVLKECKVRNYDITCITRGNRDHRLPEGIKIIHGNVNKLDEILPALDQYYDSILDFLSFDVVGLNHKLFYLSSRCKQYFFVSSSVAYSFKDTIITEETPLGNEYWDYGSNKVKCEKYLEKFCDEHNIKYTIIRPYITYGKTRIPFGIIPVSGEYWSLANRIINHKPILLWDDGKANCTLTHTEDFAKGFVDLIGNKQAFNQAYHITSDEVLSWKSVLDLIGKSLNESPIVFSKSTQEIIKVLPEYKGVLEGDKARDRVFNNQKIKEASINFRDFKPFSEGISETIQNYISNPIERVVDYTWDGRIDRAIISLSKGTEYKIDKKLLKYKPAEGRWCFGEYAMYLCGRYPFLDKIHCFFVKVSHLPRKIVSYTKKHTNKKCTFNIDKNNFHFFGENCHIGNCDFGLDRKLISIGNHVYISDGVRFINYRSSAEWFNSLFSNGKESCLRDLGPITIRDNVYISSKVTIYPNVTIGNNSLILEGAVITESVPERSVISGNPGRVIDSFDNWYKKLIEINNEYPWYDKQISHDCIIRLRENYFFED